MAAVVTFWQFPEDEGPLLDYLETTGDIVACSTEAMSAPDEIQPRPVREVFADRAIERMVITPRRFIELVHFNGWERDGRIWYRWYYGNGPLVNYSRPRWCEGRLELSNLCANPYRSEPDPTSPHGLKFPRQPPEFMAWRKRIYGWVRRHTQPLGYYRATPAVLQARTTGAVSLDPNPYGGKLEPFGQAFPEG